jgi:hypothetical protein
MNKTLWFAIALQLAAALYHSWNARRCVREWKNLRALNHIVWSYTKELVEKGVTLPPRCAMCCQILPRHVDMCLIKDLYAMERPRPTIKYYPKGEHPPHPEGEEPPCHG